VLAESLAAWILLPAVAAAIAYGTGLLLERLSGWRAPALRLPVGLCAAVCICLLVYRLGGTAPVALAAVGIPALLGPALARSELRSLRPGWLALAWLAAYGLHIAPVVLSGAWTWTGYNFVNDTSVQLLLADHLASHATAMPDVAQPNTATEHVRVYFETAYPLGSHALLATLWQAVPIPLAALYQPLIAVLAASTAVALASLVRRVGLPPAASAAAGLAAVAANLYFQYGLQGNIKEVAFLLALTGAAATGRELLSAAVPVRAAPATAVCFAAAFAVYSAAAAPYLLALGAALALAGFGYRRRSSLRRLALAGVGLLALSLLFALPALLSAAQFNRVASGTFASAARAADLGQLLRPLQVIQTGGVWLTGDYRGPVPGVRGGISSVLCALVLALAVGGLVAALRRREPGLAALVIAMVVSALYLLPRLSPYADGKVLALASPVFVLAAAVGAWALWRLSPPLGVVLVAAVALGIAWSDAFAYHAVKLAPVGRLEALDQLAARYRGARGLVLVNEPEELAKNFTGGAPVNVATEAITPKQVQLRVPQGFAAKYFDLDEETLSYVEQFPVIIKRRSPDASRPPANFRLDSTNGWYEAWTRRPAPKVVDHLPLQAGQRRAIRPSCADVRELGRIARPGETLVAATAPPDVRLHTSTARRSAGWLKHPYLPGMVVTDTPGQAVERVRVRAAGRYRAWIAGSFGRPVEARVDARRIGSAEGVNNLGQWQAAGSLGLRAGEHRLELERRGGSLKPGDGYKGELGPLVLSLEARTSLQRVPPSGARRLCAGSWDWIELVRPGA